MKKLEDKLAALATLSPAQLREEWSRLHKAPAPRIAPDLLARGLAYRLQEKAHGAMSTTTIRELARIATPGTTAPAARSVSIRPGARLIRTWHGRTIEVVVLEKGFLFDEQRYSSLTSIARAVTGAAWSGPRFFGLNSGG